MNDYSLMELMNCSSIEEVREKILKWGSKRSTHEHLIRSSILDIHAHIEKHEKDIIFEHLKELISLYEKEEYEKNVAKLEKTIEKMSFREVHKLLKPSFDSFKDGDIEFIDDITELRNRLAHGHISDLTYRGKNPFTDGECLAEIFWHSWSAIKALQHFYERKILDYKAFKKKHINMWVPR